MWCVSKDYIYSYLQLTNQYLKRIDSSKDWTGFEMVLKELLNNVYDHASDPGKEPAYVFAQYSNSREKLSLVISDIGIGLANKINLHRENANEAALSTEDAVKKAFESGYSTKSVPTNRGLGLDNVASLVQSTKSVLHCYTGDLHMVVNKDGFCPQKTTFEPMGTLFHMELNTKLLPSEGESDDELSW
jgi:anti-sigma regulatory factor (Ser/Thr protein kinase)